MSFLSTRRKENGVKIVFTWYNVDIFIYCEHPQPITVWNWSHIYTFRWDVLITECPLNYFLCLCIFDLQNVNGVLQFSQLRVLKRRKVKEKKKKKKNILLVKKTKPGWFLSERSYNICWPLPRLRDVLSNWTTWKSHDRTLWTIVQNQLNRITIIEI